jgi:predicted PurR-regulated permease PerM
MNNQKSQFYLLLAFLGATFILMFFIFRPFLYVLVLAALFAVVFYPIYLKILAFLRNKKTPAALLALFLIIIFILVPLVLLGVQVLQEASRLYYSVAGAQNWLGSFELSGELAERAQPLISYFKSIDFQNYFKQALLWMVQNLGVVFSSLTKMVLDLVIFLIALFYLMRDGAELKNKLFELSPLAQEENHLIFGKLHAAVNSVMKGNVIIELLHGLTISVGLFIFSVPNPILWGMVAAVAAMVPGFGTALVVVPAAIYLYFSGKVILAAGIIVWGLVANGFIDNFLRPKIVGKGLQVHELIILLSVFGGLAFFGPIGFLLGPLVASLFLTLVHSYSYFLKKPINQ